VSREIGPSTRLTLGTAAVVVAACISAVLWAANELRRIDVRLVRIETTLQMRSSEAAAPKKPHHGKEL
jgi:hypothetical protein